MIIAFWGSAIAIGWTYVVFPVVVLVRAALRPRPIAAAAIEPSVSIILAARNEARAIGSRLDNLAALTYAAERLEVVVAVNGSSDETADIARGHPIVASVIDLPDGGKAAALEAAVATARGDVLIFTDANTRFAVDAVSRIVRPFADPEVGGVAGDQRYETSDKSAARGERSYWDLDRRLKLAESRAGSTVSATGALYAVRRELFSGVHADATDDFYISTGVVARGRRLVFEPTAVAHEPPAPTLGLEFERKVRIMTRGLTGVWARSALLDPRRHGFYAVQLLSHKVLRRMMAIPLGFLLLSGTSLGRRGWPYATVAVVGWLTVLLGAMGLALRDRAAGRHPLLALPAYLIAVNSASLVALARLITGRRITRWSPRRISRGQPPSTRS
jgi:hypothetical protein